jgi:uncharacterized protein YjdB
VEITNNGVSQFGYDPYAYAFYAGSGAPKITINGGTYSMTAQDDTAVIGANYSSHYADINGGYFKMISTSGDACVGAHKQDATVYGGTFNVDPTSSSTVSDECAVVDNTADTTIPSGYTHRVKTLPVAEVEGKQFSSLQEAIDKAVTSADKTVTLLRNASIKDTLTISGDVDIVAGSWDLIFNGNPALCLKPGVSMPETISDMAPFEAMASRSDGSVYYSTLAQATNSNSTVKLAKDLTITSHLSLSNGRTLDLNGFNITLTPVDPDESAFELSAGLNDRAVNVSIVNTAEGKSTITGGIEVTNFYTTCNSYTFTLGKNVEVQGFSPLFLEGNGSAGSVTANIYGSLVVNGLDSNGYSYAAIQGNGQAEYAGTVINIYEGAVLDGSTFNAGIFHPQGGVLNIYGGEVKGLTGIYLKSGTLNISGGTITGTGNQNAYTYKPSGFNSTGDGLAVDNCGYPGGTPVVNITGGDFSSTNGDPVGSYKRTDDSTQTTGPDVAVIGFIKGGSFSKIPAQVLVAEGYEVKEDNGKYVVTTVTVPVSGISLDQTSLTLTIGDTSTLKATVSPANATDKSVIWSTSHEEIATVGQDGTVTAVGVGEAIITATAGDKKAECKVTVSYADVASITLNETELTLAQGGTTTLTATVLPENADKTVEWSSSDANVATVDQHGTVKAIGAGKAIITAKAGELESTCTVTVSAEGQVIPDVAAPVVFNQISGVTDSQKEEITETAQSVTTDDTIADAVQAEADGLSAVEKNELVTKAQEKLDLGEDVTINLFSQAYLEIIVTSATVEDNNITSITLDIEPKVQIVASTASSIKDVTPQNGVVVRAVEPLRINKPIQISVNLLEDLADASDSFYVKHVKDDDSTYYYKGSVANGVLTFTNLHGFSTFTFPADSEVKAAIGNEGYASLQKAVDAVGNNGTITLTQNNSEAIAVQKSITFTLDKGIYDFDSAAITAGPGYMMSYTVGEGTVTNTFTRISTGDDSSDVSGDYIVNVASVSGGKVTVNPGRADKGDTVTITAVPNDGYVLQSLTVTEKDGSTVRVSDKGNDKYTFTMPGSTVTVKAVFVREDGTVVTPVTSFTDVAESHWAYNEIQWAAENGYMNGTSATTFNPTGTITRQQVWMILARMAGADPANMAAAKTWAVNNGISDGTNPGDPVSRQQLVALLYRFAGQNGYDTTAKADLSGYPDVASLAGYATDAMAWAVANGIVGGTTQGTLNPAGTANRAQFAAILWRFYQTAAA